MATPAKTRGDSAAKQREQHSSSQPHDRFTQGVPRRSQNYQNSLGCVALNYINIITRRSKKHDSLNVQFLNKWTFAKQKEEGLDLGRSCFWGTLKIRIDDHFKMRILSEKALEVMRGCSLKIVFCDVL